MQSMEQPLDFSQVMWYVSFRGHNYHLKYTLKMLNKSQTNVKRETFKTYFHNFFQKNCQKYGT